MLTLIYSVLFLDFILLKFLFSFLVEMQKGQSLLFLKSNSKNFLVFIVRGDNPKGEGTNRISPLSL